LARWTIRPSGKAGRGEIHQKGFLFLQKAEKNLKTGTGTGEDPTAHDRRRKKGKRGREPGGGSPYTGNMPGKARRGNRHARRMNGSLLTRRIAGFKGGKG